MSKLKNNFVLIFVILIAIFLGIVIASCITFYTAFQRSGGIAPGTFIKGVNVSGMSKEEAKTVVSNYLKENMSDHLVFKYSNYEYNVEIEQIEASFDVNSAVEYAYSLARGKGFFQNAKDYVSILMNNINIDPVLVYNEEALNEYMDFLEVSLPDQVEQASYYIEDDKLIITTGSTGCGINKTSLKKLVLESMQDMSFSNMIFVIPTYTTYPDKLDIDNIHDEVYKEMSNAYYTTEPYAIYVEKTGVDFDVEKVKSTVTEVRNKSRV